MNYLILIYRIESSIMICPLLAFEHTFDTTNFYS